MHIDPFEMLLDIEQKCRTYAKPLPSQKAIARLWQGVGFICAAKHYVAPLTEIKEVLLLPELTVLPSAAGWFRGISNMRGHLLPITDLAGFMVELVEKKENKAAAVVSQSSALSRVLVIDFEGSPVGFLVEQVLGIQRFSTEAFKFNAPTEEAQTFNDGKKIWHLLSLEALSQMPMFNHVVKQRVI